MNIRNRNGAVSGFGFTFPSGVLPTVYAEGKNFNCTVSICYGIGTEAHANFVKFQRLLNALAPLAGYPRIAEDGKFGSVGPTSTTQTAKQAGRFLIALPQFAGNGFFQQMAAGDKIDDRRALARNVTLLNGQLEGALKNLGLSVSTAPTPSPTTPSLPTPPVTAPGMPMPVSLPTIPLEPPRPPTALAQEVVAICKSNPNDPRCAEARAICKAGGPDASDPVTKKLCRELGAGSKAIWWIVGGVAFAGVVGAAGYVIYRRRRRA